MYIEWKSTDTRLQTYCSFKRNNIIITTTTTTTKQKTIMPGSSKERDEGARNVYEYYGQLQNKWFNNQNVYEMRTVKKPKNRRQYPEKKHVKRDYY
eukprot:m.142952 g.142952  ORF g.142952 m.142952 type:complete len:96 (-) comp16006_c5_seq5:348-635(-)